MQTESKGAQAPVQVWRDYIDPRDVMMVYDVYHQRCYVDSTELARSKTMLRLVTKAGKYVRDKDGNLKVIHRENLAGGQTAMLQERISAVNIANYELTKALKAVVSWHQRATCEQQKTGPVMLDYLSHAAKAATEALAKSENWTA